MLVRELLPGSRIVLLFRVVKVLAAGTRDQVDHAFWRRVALAIELLVEFKLAVNEPLVDQFAVLDDRGAPFSPAGMNCRG